MHCSLCLLPIFSVDKVFKWLVFLTWLIFFSFGRQKKVVPCCVRQVVVLYNNDCTGIISYSSTKSMVPPLHKFTTRNVDLIFSPFLLNIAVYSMTSQYFGSMEKNCPIRK